MSSIYKRSPLRWVGNKYDLLPDIHTRIPNKFSNYHEPFLGSATVFINIKKKGLSFLSDSNPNLINFFKQVKENLNDIFPIIEKKEDNEEFYIEESKKVYTDLLEQAAQFYYLNRASFNGIHRVNSSGIYNVPYRKKPRKSILDKTNLILLKNDLENVVLNACDFEYSLNNIQENDFIFLDPPYTPPPSNAKKKEVFTAYTEKPFLWSDQLRLKNFCESIIAKKAMFMMTNLFYSEIYGLFAKELQLNWCVTERYEKIGSSQNSRGLKKEYLFTNYPIIQQLKFDF